MLLKMNGVKKYQFHVIDTKSKTGYKDVPVFLSTDGTLSIEGYVAAYYYFNELFICSWEVSDIFGQDNKSSYSPEKEITDFLDRKNSLYIKRVVVGKNAEPQYCYKGGCLVDKYHQEICLITEEAKDLNIADSEKVKNIGKYAGKYWSYDKTLFIPESIMSIGRNAFYKSQISELVFKGKQNGEFSLEIEGNAFFMCEKLKSVNFGKRKIKIFSGAFRYSHIENLDIPENVEIKEDGMRDLLYAFNINIHCKKLSPRGFFATGELNPNGCTINMEDVEIIEIDRNYNSLFIYSKLNKVIMSSKLYDSIIRAGALNSWKDNVEEIEIRWYSDGDKKITK